MVFGFFKKKELSREELRKKLDAAIVCSFCKTHIGYIDGKWTVLEGRAGKAREVENLFYIPLDENHVLWE